MVLTNLSEAFRLEREELLRRGPRESWSGISVKQAGKAHTEVLRQEAQLQDDALLKLERGPPAAVRTTKQFTSRDEARANTAQTVQRMRYTHPTLLRQHGGTASEQGQRERGSSTNLAEQRAKLTSAGSSQRPESPFGVGPQGATGNDWARSAHSFSSQAC